MEAPSEQSQHFRDMAEALRAQPSAKPPSTKKTRISKRVVKRLMANATGEGKSPPGRNERCDAIEEIGQSGIVEAIPLLVKLSATSAEPLKVREAAAAALGDLGDPESLPSLVELLDAPESEIRQAALMALGKLGDRRAVRPLIHYGLHHPHSKFVAWDAVVKMGDEAVIDLLDALGHSDDSLVLESVVLVGRIKTPKAVPLLVQVIETRSPLFRSHAAESLGQIGDRRAVPALVSLLKDADPAVRANATSALIRIPDRQAIDPLRQMLTDEDADVRLHAIQALAEIGDARAVPDLLERLNDPSAEVQVAAAEALGQCGDARAVEPLLERLQSDDEAILLRAISALRRLKDPRAAQALLGLLSDERDVVRQRAVDTLGLVGDAEIAQRLEQVLKYDRSELVRANAAKSLGTIGDPGSIEALIDALHDEFPIRCRVVVSLGILHDDAALPAISALLRDAAPEIRYHAVGALMELNPPNALTLVEPLIDDPNAMVRRGVAKALEKLGDPRAAELQNDSTKRKLSRTMRDARKGMREAIAMLTPSWLASFLPTGPRGRIAATSAAAVLLLTAVGLAALPMFSRKHAGRVVRRGQVQSVAFSDAGTIAAARTAGIVEVWDVPSKSIKKTAQIDVYGPIFAMDGKVVGLPGEKGLQFWSLDNDKGPDKKPGVHQKQIVSVAVSPDRQFAATMDGDRVVYTWSLATREAVGALQLPKNTIPGTLALLPGGKRIVTGAIDGGFFLWDVENAQQLVAFPPFRTVIARMAISPDGKLLAVAGNNNLGVFSLENYKEVTAPKIQGNVMGLEFSPTGKWLIVLNGSNIHLVTPNTDMMKSIVIDDAALLETVAISPDEKLLAAGNPESSKIWLCDAESAEVLKRLDVK
jgi:HEAT repeat protein